MSVDLVVRSTVRELVKAWEEACAAVRTSFAAIVVAEKRLHDTFALDGPSIRIDASGYGYHDNFADADGAIARMRRQAWRVLVERLELRRILSAARWKELERSIEKDELPEITEANVIAFVRGHWSNLDKILEESIVEVYNYLRPRETSRGANYKTNDRVEVGRKVVLPYVVESWFDKSWRVSYHRTQDLVALENVFSALDGRGQVAKAYGGEIGAAIAAAGPDGRGETRYFRFRCFKNRNLHLEFLRTDLLAKFNAIAGGKNLRPATRGKGVGHEPAIDGEHRG